MSQPRTRICSYCHEERSWLWNGNVLKDGTKIYTDEHEKRWAGRRCPPCERRRVAKALRTDKLEKEVISNSLKKHGFEFENIDQVKMGEKLNNLEVRHAYAQDGQVVLEKGLDPDSDNLYAVVFYTVRLLDNEGMRKLSEGATITSQ